MRARVVPAVVASTVLALSVLPGCTADEAPPRPAAAASPTVAPSLGAASAAKSAAGPGPKMDKLERPVAKRLAAQIGRQGLTLSSLDCPAWDGTVPEQMTCRAYVDDLVVPVKVDLRAAVQGKAVSFDAELAGGVIATQRLEETLAEQGGSAPDCGEVRAYPAEVGLEIVCRITRDDQERYVVATVSDRSGRVMISDYEPAS